MVGSSATLWVIPSTLPPWFLNLLPFFSLSYFITVYPHNSQRGLCFCNLFFKEPKWEDTHLLIMFINLILLMWILALVYFKKSVLIILAFLSSGTVQNSFHWSVNWKNTYQSETDTLKNQTGQLFQVMHEINLKWIKDLTVRPGIIKLLEETTGSIWRQSWTGVLRQRKQKQK